MTAFLDKLNLRPHERRLVAGIAIVFFIVMNVWFVWPHFDDWQIVSNGKIAAEKTLRNYQMEIARMPAHRSKLSQLEAAGSSVVADEQELDLVRTVDLQSRAAGVTLMKQSSRPMINTGQTNQFFEEQSIAIQTFANNEELVNFLISLASTNSLIRVRDMSLSPDPSGTRLKSDMTLVASYQKKTPAKPAPAPPATARSGAQTNRPAQSKAATNAAGANPRSRPDSK